MRLAHTVTLAAHVFSWKSFDLPLSTSLIGTTHCQFLDVTGHGLAPCTQGGVHGVIHAHATEPDGRTDGRQSPALACILNKSRRRWIFVLVTRSGTRSKRKRVPVVTSYIRLQTQVFSSRGRDGSNKEIYPPHT